MLFCVLCRCLCQVVATPAVGLFTESGDEAVLMRTQPFRMINVAGTDISLVRPAIGLFGRKQALLLDANANDVRAALPDLSAAAIDTVLVLPLRIGNEAAVMCVYGAGSELAGTETLSILQALATTCGLTWRALRSEEAAMRSSQRHRRLIAEMQHRIRGLLALVRSVVRRSSRTAHGSLQDFTAHLQARIDALGRAQGALAAAGWSGPQLEDLVQAELAATASPADKYLVGGPSLRLHVQHAETLAMALHELTTNSLKYGALATPGAHLTVTWSVNPDAHPPRLRLKWIERGVGIAATAPRHSGFGQEFIESLLPRQLAAHTSFVLLPGGLQCMIELPLPLRVSRLDGGATSTNAKDAHHGGRSTARTSSTNT